MRRGQRTVSLALFLTDGRLARTITRMGSASDRHSESNDKGQGIALAMAEKVSPCRFPVDAVLPAKVETTV